MSHLLDGELKKAPPLSRASRKGARFAHKGKPITSCPYTNPKRKAQFEWAWEETINYLEWQEDEIEREAY